jgi:IS5 family transposase
MNIMQAELVIIDNLVAKNHIYRKLKDLINFDRIAKSVHVVKSEFGTIGYGLDRLIMCLILQFVEDLSDREMERFIAENVAGKWFCNFTITEKTPDYSSFCKFRAKLGCKQISNIFAEVKSQLTAKGYLSEVFTFIDATALTSKLSLWEEKDKSIQDGYDKLNNKNLPKYTKDKDVRIGSKSKNKYWIGYKKHVSVDTQSGMINKVAVTKANVTDADGLKHVCPTTGAVLADKGYVGAIDTIKAKGAHPMVILRNNMKTNNKDKDRWITGLHEQAFRHV